MNGSIEKGTKLFATLFHARPDVISRAPGRAEILGCHTDYNRGLTLSAAISESTFGFFHKRKDMTVQAFSTAYPDQPVNFNVRDETSDPDHPWGNYVRAIVAELAHEGLSMGGANILIDSTVPKSGGVSSSAALELATAYGLLALHKHDIDPMKAALLSKRAENGPLVGSPCGFLDQGTIAFAKEGGVVFMDYRPAFDAPVSEIKVIDAHIAPDTVSFVIPFDRTLERQLGQSAYVERRQTCEAGVSFFATKLERPIESLRGVTSEDFVRLREALEEHNPQMRKRVEHVVYENARVRTALLALKAGNTPAFGELLTQSGKSGLELFELDEQTPQLTFLVTFGRDLPGVLGMRNMGGGFSAVALALVEKEKRKQFRKKLSEAYTEAFDRPLEFIEFSPSQGAEILSSK
jgi:galactokinase